MFGGIALKQGSVPKGLLKAHAKNFREAQVSCQESFSLPAFQRLGEAANMMVTEIAARRGQLRYLTVWLRYREVSQRWLAERLGVSEATVSKWIGGTQAMSVAQLATVAQLLDCEPYELLWSPHETAKSKRYKEFAEILDSLSPSDLDHYIAIGRSIAKRDQP
jgi:transcriptional regulator with XRE-family HTH domain